MTTMKIGAPNWCEANWATITALTGSFGTTLDNLKDPDFGNPAVGSTLPTVEILVDLGPVITIIGGIPASNSACIPRSNLTQAATWRVKGGSAPFTAGGGGGGSVAYDSTAVSAKTQNPYPTSVVMFGAVNPTVFQPQVDNSYNYPAVLLFPSAITARYWYIAITDASNPDGYISLARLFIGPLFQPTYNMEYGVTIELYGTRQADTSVANVDFIDPTPTPRRLVTFNNTELPEDEATAYWLRLALYLGYAKQCLFVFNPADTYNLPLRTFMATQLKLGSISYKNVGTGDFSGQFLEV